MLNPLKFLLTCQLKLNDSQKATQNRGFTLLELLVGLAMALLILTPLLGFLINIMTSDRQEQAKATTEQDIQASLDYISRDMQQAVYVYGQTALTTNSVPIPVTGTIPASGIRNQIPSTTTGCPANTTCTPKLAFWKRKYIPKVIPTDSSTNCSRNPEDCNDAFVYSLVVYYLVKDNTCDGSSVWSCASRIGRFEIQDGVRDERVSSRPPLDPTPGNSKLSRDPGFQPFTIEGRGSIPEKMNTWVKKSGENYNKPIETLVDYIDNDTAEGFKVEDPPNVTVTGIIAKISIRGNALARTTRGTPPVYNPNSKNTIAYFPTAKVQIKGRGLLGESE